MRVFVTGASGFVGSAVVRELLDAGHQVVGLALTDQGAVAVAAAGAEVHRGDIADLDSLRKPLVDTEAVIHRVQPRLHRPRRGLRDRPRGHRPDRRDARRLEPPVRHHLRRGRPRPGRGQAHQRGGRAQPRRASRAPGALGNIGLSYAERGVRVSLIRLPLSVHGEGDHAFVPMIIAAARELGFVPLVGDGSNRWPAVHRLDAARLFRLAVESAPAGAKLHGIDEEGVRFRDIAEVIGRHLNLPANTVSAAQAIETWGSQERSSARTFRRRVHGPALCSAGDPCGPASSRTWRGATTSTTSATVRTASHASRGETSDTNTVHSHCPCGSDCAHRADDRIGTAAPPRLRAAPVGRSWSSTPPGFPFTQQDKSARVCRTSTGGRAFTHPRNG